MPKGIHEDAFPLKWPDGWPRTPPGSRGGPYRFNGLTPSRGISTLIEELNRLGATNVVISSNAPTRASGVIDTEKLSRRLDDPGVAVYFTYSGKQMVMAQDAYNAPYVNCRSLALAINAMRAIERHGGGYMMQRSFDGFAALPPPEGSHTAKLRPWREVLEMGDASGPNTIILAGAEAQYRSMARTAHPDQAGGSAERMAELNAAIEQARKELL